MKTSPTQFEMLVNFMEEHGDLNKPTSNMNANGRIKAIRLWERLTNILNSDSSGTSKITEKWKKVWSDLKNNTKRKAAKITKAAGGTGGGPALQLKLSELDQRILNILGPQAATGLPGVTEAGFTQNLCTAARQQEHDSNRTLTITLTPVADATIDDSPSILSFMGYQNRIEPDTMTLEDAIDSIPVEFFSMPSVASPVPLNSSPPQQLRPTPPPFTDSPTRTSPERRPLLRTPPARRPLLRTPPARRPLLRTPPARRPLVHTPPVQTPPARVQTPPARVRARGGERFPAYRGQTQTPRHGRVAAPRRIGSPRRRHRPLTQVEQAAQQFLECDESWRNFLIRQHEDKINLQREKIRVEERWQNIAQEAIAALTRILDSRL